MKKIKNQSKKKYTHIVSDVNVGFNPITKVDNKEKNVVILEDERKSIEETLFLSNVPRLVENIKEIKNTENWASAKAYNPDEKW